MEFVQMIGELLGAGGSTVSLHALTPCQLVQHQKDQTVQEQGVEEANGAGHFVGENQTPHAKCGLVPGAQAQVFSLPLLKDRDMKEGSHRERRPYLCQAA